MSWYNNKLKKHSEIMGENCNILTITITIINLETYDDYEIITNALKSIRGVEGFGNYRPKKLSITYNQSMTSLEHIVYKLSNIGYRYINRF